MHYCPFICQRAQPIRLFLEYLGEEYTERRYGQEEFGRWQQEKCTIDLDFPNLPYYMDGDFHLSQSMAIIRYIADKHNQLGKDPKDRARISMLEGAVIDLRSAISTMAYSPQLEEEKKKLLEKMPVFLQKFALYLGTKQFLTGDKPIYVDFMLYEALDCVRYLDSNTLNKFGCLTTFMKRIEDLPPIKKYMNSDRFIKWPLQAWFAGFGGGSAPPS
ncbi:Glutathione S-transferase Mu [Fasciola hepatica]|uniref:glutathione transferase n=1 Tax=Fasciola hepatica TaxID=6192 RepID=A0A4E0RFI5_FASHE|nr:Glutathione S-transferase Mu [Fasciola hepatica]